MKKIVFILSSIFISNFAMGQTTMNPELLWKVKRISPVGLSKDKKNVVYSATSYGVEADTKETIHYTIPINGGTAQQIGGYKGLIDDNSFSPDGKHQIEVKEVKVNKVLGKDLYPQYKESNMMVYDDLAYRHWDTWYDGTFNHLFLKIANSTDKGIDLLEDEPYDSPQKPFGGNEDYTWSPDGSKIIYVAKKKFGKNFALSTDTDLYEYNIDDATTTNLTQGMMGYDTAPAYSKDGHLAFLSMARDGYEADKNDIVVKHKNTFYNLTANWDETVFSFKWAEDASKIYFLAPTKGTVQLFKIEGSSFPVKGAKIAQLTTGQFDIVSIVDITSDKAIVTRTDMNHAAELYTVDLKSGKISQLSHVNDAFYENIAMGEVKPRITKTKDGKDLFSWVIYPPNFDPGKKYPTLLYCQGGPQSALTQFYSFRWNFQLMAANGYIIIAPNRRGMPGHGTAWNEAISKDWGGKAMDDYLVAIDDIAKEEYVDSERLGAIGASFGGYSVFYLAGMHNNRFKTFISHDGVFNLKSMYGTTEELWFTNWDAGGPYWDKYNKDAVKTYSEFDPSNEVAKWNTPMLIIQGGKDYRVPIGQGLEAFQAAQLKGLKSRLLFFPEENHWVLHPQNSVIWHTEFFKWLKETL